mmetsp:Transcript_81832/g.210816  ORF Transcript_81832/g.210816 Transcript_81832/m.210816 type:complete len:197 (-) Transcript_81832:78-668(-)
MADDGSPLTMPEVVQKVLEGFQDPKFQAEVDEFACINIPLFARVCQDGSQPLEWDMQFKKYKTLYERQLQRVLDLCGADVTEFMDYLGQCCEAYSGQPGYESFDQLMAQLTQGESYEHFLEVMFHAVRENWLPEPEAAAPPQPDVQVHPVNVTVPDGVGPGMVFHVEYLGLVHPVQCPEGVGPGTVLEAHLQVPAA